MSIFNKLNDAYVKWLSQFHVDYMVTVPLRKKLLGLWPIDESSILKTARHFRKGITQKTAGRHARILFMPFFERGPKDDRPHLHLAFESRNNRSKSELQAIIKPISSSSEWAFENCELTPITYDGGLTKYLLKQGVDSFVPEAAFLPPLA